MRARYNYSYSYGKENGDLQSRKQCFDEGKTTCKNYRENVHKKKAGYAQDGKRMYISCNRREKMGRKTKKGSETLLPGSCFRTS